MRMPEPAPIHNPITGSIIKEGGKTHARLVRDNFLNADGTVKASQTRIAEEKARLASVTAERLRVRKLRARGTVEERVGLALADIKTAEEAVRVTAVVCAYVKATFASEIKSLSEGISALHVNSGVHE